MINISIPFVLAAIVSVVSAQALTINTPSSIQACLPAQLTWTGGVSPYFVSLILGGEVNSAIQKDFGQVNANSLTWPQVDLPAGKSYTLQIRDSTGQINYSDKFTIQTSTTQCSLGSSNGTSTSTSTAPTTTSTSTPATSATKPATNTTSSSTSTSAGKANTTTTTTGSTTTPATTSTTGASTTNTTGAQAGATTGGATHLLPSVAAVGLSMVLALFA